MPSLDPNSPLATALANGLAQQVEVKDIASADDPIAMAQSIRRRQQAQQMQEMALQEVARAQQLEQAKADAEIADSQMRQLEAEAKREEMMARLEEYRRERRIGAGGGEAGMSERLLAHLLEEQQAARAEAQALRDQMQRELSSELAQMRADLRNGAVGQNGKAGYDKLSEDLAQVKDLMTLVSTFQPSSQFGAMSAETSMSLKQLEMTQEFELRKAQLDMERVERDRRYDEERQARAAEWQLRQAELEQRGKRDRMLGEALSSVTPRIADALSGVQAVPRTLPPAGGPGQAPPEAAPSAVHGEAGTLHCPQPGCGNPIPIGPNATNVTCSRCGRNYDVGRKPD